MRMTVHAIKALKGARRKKAGGKESLSLPSTTLIVEIGGEKYFITPTIDMKEWLEDLEDIMDSIDGMKTSEKAIP